MSTTLQVLREGDRHGRPVLPAGAADADATWVAGTADLLCGSCGFTLAVGVAGPSHGDAVVRCPDCEQLNES
jgi:hypothetical protein